MASGDHFGRTMSNAQRRRLDYYRRLRDTEHICRHCAWWTEDLRCRAPDNPHPEQDCLPTDKCAGWRLKDA